MKDTVNENQRKMNCLSNDLNGLYHIAARKLGISDSVLCVLYIIYEKGDGCLLYDICNESGISKQTINSALRRLEAAEILYLEHAKGNAKRVFLTEKGGKYLNETAARIYEAECNVFKSWSEEEISLYFGLMRKYTDSLKNEINKMRSAL